MRTFYRVPKTELKDADGNVVDLPGIKLHETRDAVWYAFPSECEWLEDRGLEPLANTWAAFWKRTQPTVRDKIIRARVRRDFEANLEVGRKGGPGDLVIRRSQIEQSDTLLVERIVPFVWWGDDREAEKAALDAES